MSAVKANFFLDSAGGNNAQINGITPALSSQAQAEAGTDNTTLMTPLRLRNALNATGTAPTYACRAWVNFNGTGTVAIRASGNVTSITDNGVGNFRVNFTTSMPDADYCAVVTQGSAAVGGDQRTTVFIAAPTTAKVDVGAIFANVVYVDNEYIMLSVFR